MKVILFVWTFLIVGEFQTSFVRGIFGFKVDIVVKQRGIGMLVMDQTGQKAFRDNEG
jgi:hypothetical protein